MPGGGRLRVPEDDVRVSMQPTMLHSVVENEYVGSAADRQRRSTRAIRADHDGDLGKSAGDERRLVAVPCRVRAPGVDEPGLAAPASP